MFQVRNVIKVLQHILHIQFLPLPISLHLGMQCELCDYVAASKSVLKKHMPSHTGARTFYCAICKVWFRYKSNLLRHQKNSHASKKTCSTCGKKVRDLRAHVKQVHKPRDFRCEVCGKEYARRSELNTHVLKHGPPSFECRYCEKLWWTPVQRREHENTHTRPYACPDCGYVCSGLQKVERHRSVCDGKKDRTCTICHEDVLNTRLDLIEHCRNSHGDGRCPHCPKTFTSVGRLRSHTLRSHPI